MGWLLLKSPQPRLCLLAVVPWAGPTAMIGVLGYVHAPPSAATPADAGSACRYNQLSPDIKKDAFTSEEDAVIMKVSRKLPAAGDNTHLPTAKPVPALCAERSAVCAGAH